MSKEKKHETPAQKIEEGAVEAISRSEAYIHKNRKGILVGIILVVLLVGGYLAYRYLYAEPREDKAYEAMYKAEHYFGVDSFQLALNGNGSDVQGFLSIIDEYKGTSAANLAHAYAGRSYYHLGDYNAAIEHLKKHNSKEIMVAPSNRGLIGDCYVALGDYGEAVKHFEEAAKMADNQLLSPIYLKKAGLAHEALGDKEKALKSYQEIKDKYYNSPEAVDIDKYIQALNYR